MSQKSFNSMNHLPSHGNASNSKVGNAREEYADGSRRAALMKANRGPAPYMQAQCAFPQPPPQRCYCHPAAFTSLDGRTYHRLLDAYGHSIPCKGVQY